MTAVAVAQGEKAPRSGHKLRALRHPVAEFGVGPLAVTAWHPRLLVLSGACDNVSLGGVCLRISGAAERVEQVQVELRYFDPTHGIREETSLVLRSNVDRQTWKVALADPTVRTWQAQISTFYTSGVTRLVPWRDQEGTMLVIPIIADPG